MQIIRRLINKKNIRKEIQAIESGNADPENNVLRNAPHSLATVTADDWPHPYSREQAAYAAPWLKSRKFWPPVDRVDNPYGDRNLVCTCHTDTGYAFISLNNHRPYACMGVGIKAIGNRLFAWPSVDLHADVSDFHIKDSMG